MSASSGIVFDIKKFSLHDGPGIRTTVFLKGCPLHCAWCHNPEGISPLKEIHYWSKRCINCHECVEACEKHAITIIAGKPVRDTSLCQGCGACVEVCPSEAIELVGRTMTASEVIQEIARDVIYYDQSGGGATFSGGEPLLQIAFLKTILEACQDRGIDTAVDTSGFVPYRNIERVKPHVDLFLYDIKMVDEKKHLKYTGVPNRRILDNLVALSLSGAEIIVRIPIIPGINDRAEDVDQAGIFLGNLGRLHQVNLLPYHHSAVAKYSRMNSVYSLQDIHPPTNERLADIAEHLESFGLSVSIGG